MKLYLFVAFFFILNVNLFSQYSKINRFIKDKDYEQAISFILDKGTVGELEDDYLQNLAYCYTMDNQFVKAEEIYEKLANKDNPKPENVLYYAEILRVNKKYDLAKANYQKYQNLNPADDYASLEIIACDSLKKWELNKSGDSVALLPAINSAFDEINCFYKDDKLFFLTTQKDTVINQDTSKISFYQKWLTDDFWCSYYSVCDETGKIAYSLRKINKVGEFAYDSSFVMIGDSNACEFQELVKFQWDTLSPNYNIAHPFFANNGNRLYFSADIPEGYGGMDIYYSDFKNNRWTKPVNLGENVNTEFNEICPSLYGDTLYFSSKGRIGYGYYDVFCSKIMNNSFGKAVNLKEPVNSIANDAFFYRTSDTLAYFSSDRIGGSGRLDIYEVTSPFVEPEVIVKKDTAEVFHGLSFSFPFILFDNDKTEIWTVYQEMLKNLSDTLKKYDNLHLTISGFTDINGSDIYNDTLSVHRAISVTNALVDLGVSLSQISYNGYGKARNNIISDAKFHVFIGVSASGNKAQAYSKLLNDKYEVKVVPYKSKYRYYVGSFDNIDDAKYLSQQLRTEFNMDNYISATYLGIYLPNYKLAINRRVELKLNSTE